MKFGMKDIKTKILLKLQGHTDLADVAFLFAHIRTQYYIIGIRPLFSIVRES